MKEDLSKYNPEESTLRKAQLCMLDILIEIDKICRKHNIEYWADSGTLLGAIRHKGFIPWDDDVDIAVRREDYMRLRDILQSELPKNMVFVDWTTDKNYFDACGRVKMRNSRVDVDAFRYQKEQGIWVDIFPMETLALYQEKVIGEFLYGKVFRHAHNSGLATKKSRLAYWVTHSIAILLYPLSYLFISVFRWHGRKKKKFITYGYALSTVTYPKHPINRIFPTQDIEFENHFIRAPHDIDSYLKDLYGDYMQIPPKDKRVTHSKKWEIW